jgi:hypothetical protein
MRLCRYRHILLRITTERVCTVVFDVICVWGTFGCEQEGTAVDERRVDASLFLEQISWCSCM